MNIKGRLIEEMELIPNVIELVTSLPKLDASVHILNKRMNALDDNFKSIEKRMYNNMKTVDDLGQTQETLNDNFENIKAMSME